MHVYQDEVQGDDGAEPASNLLHVDQKRHPRHGDKEEAGAKVGQHVGPLVLAREVESEASVAVRVLRVDFVQLASKVVDRLGEANLAVLDVHSVRHPAPVHNSRGVENDAASMKHALEAAAVEGEVGLVEAEHDVHDEPT